MAWPTSMLTITAQYWTLNRIFPAWTAWKILSFPTGVNTAQRAVKNPAILIGKVGLTSNQPTRMAIIAMRFIFIKGALRCTVIFTDLIDIAPTR